MSNFRGISDPRDYGSKNPGATNVFRSGDRLAGLLTFLGDFAKGYLSVVLASVVSQILLNNQSSITVITVLVSIAVVLGHIFPVFYGFKGRQGSRDYFWCSSRYLICHWRAGKFSVGNHFPDNKDFWFCRYINSAFPSGNLLFVIKMEYHQEFWLVYGMICILSTLLLFRHSTNILELRRGFKKKNEN